MTASESTVVTDGWLARLAPQLHLAWQGDWEAGQGEPPRRLYDHELVVVRAGACDITIDGTVHRCVGPSFVVVPPGAVHSSHSASGTRRFCAHFDWDCLAPAPEGLLWAVLPQSFANARLRAAPGWAPDAAAPGPVTARSEVGRVCDALLARWREGGSGRLRARAALLDLLVLLFAPGAPRTSEAERERELALAVRDALDRVDPATVAIRTHLRGLGRSYEHLERCFRRHIGCTPRAYLAALRIDASRRLLARGEAVVTVARRLGFCSSSHFIRVFRSQTGTTPGRLRD